MTHYALPTISKIWRYKDIMKVQLSEPVSRYYLDTCTPHFDLGKRVLTDWAKELDPELQLRVFRVTDKSTYRGPVTLRLELTGFPKKAGTNKRKVRSRNIVLKLISKMGYGEIPFVDFFEDSGDKPGFLEDKVKSLLFEDYAEQGIDPAIMGGGTLSLSQYPSMDSIDSLTNSLDSQAEGVAFRSQTTTTGPRVFLDEYLDRVAHSNDGVERARYDGLEGVDFAAIRDNLTIIDGEVGETGQQEDINYAITHGGPTIEIRSGSTITLDTLGFDTS